MKTVRLYYHQTDGGAEYLYDTFVVCPNGHKEGAIMPETQFAVRLDGAPELRLRGAAAKALELLECLKRAAEIEKDSIDFDNRGRMSGTGTFPYPEWLETARALIAEIEGGEV